MDRVQERIRPSLLAFVNHEFPEVEYLALKTIYYIIHHYKL